MSNPSAWLVLLVAGQLEVAWDACLKSAAGFTRPGPTAGLFAGMLASVGLLGLSLKSLPLGTAYAVWTGIGAVGTVLFGILALGEPAEWRRLACIGLILAGVLGLKLVAPE